ncbi:Rhomboid family protein [compost metagenome]
MFGDIRPVTKNLLILNVALFILTLFFQYQGQGLDLGSLLGAHYFGTPLFQPYQIVTHFFMHGGWLHILLNMYVLVMFGSFLERIWGPKRYFILYVASALGAFLLYSGVGFFQITQLKATINNPEALAALNGLLKEVGRTVTDVDLINIAQRYGVQPGVQFNALGDYTVKSIVPMVGASGAIFGLLAAFAILFPNTELQLLFPPIPIKAKWLIGGYFVFEVYNSFQNNTGDNVAHLAHVGGAIVGAIIVLIWRKKGQNFY